MHMSRRSKTAHKMIARLQKLRTEVRKVLITSPSERLIRKVSAFTMASPAKLESLIRLSEQIATNGIAGDFVECGVYKGGSAAVLASHMPPSAKLWLYDSFCGMPQTTPRDGTEASKWVGQCRASPEDVVEV